MWPLKFHECDWKYLPWALVDFLQYEQGYRWAESEDAEVVHWPAPDEYVPFLVKVEWYVANTNFRVPEEWDAAEPGQPRLPPKAQLIALMNMRPMGAVARQEQLNSREWRTQQVQCPVGQSYYEVIAVAIDEEHGIAKKSGTSIVVFCKEQVLEWIAGERVIGWPTATLSLSGLERRGDGPFKDPRDQMPLHDWISVHMEEEIELKVGRLRDEHYRNLNAESSSSAEDDGDDEPPAAASRLSTISEQASPSGL